MSTAPDNAQALVQAAMAPWLIDDPAGSKPAALETQTHNTCFVAYSGGMDSTVLLHAAAQAVGARPLTALHLDHGLDPDSRRWSAHCRAVCEALSVSLVSERLPAGTLDVEATGLEAAARSARYRFFRQHVRYSGELLLMAHHADDQAETLLLRQLQGRGVLPMPVQRALGEARLCRPLLQLPRSVLQAYAQQQQLQWIEDPSNTSLQMDRNYLRHQVWPTLAQRWPQAASALARVADNVSQTEAALATVLAQQPSLPVSWATGEGGVALLRAWLAGFEEFAATDRALAEFVRQLAVAQQGQPQLRLRAGVLLRCKTQVCYQPHE